MIAAMQADVGHATGIILLASQVLLQRLCGVPRQYSAAAHILGAGCAQCRCLWRRTQARAEIAVMQAADMGCAMALNIWCLRLCCGCC